MKKLKTSLKIFQQKNKLKNTKNIVQSLKKNIKFVYAHENVVIPIIMGSRSPKAIEFRTSLGFSQYDITLKKRIISVEVNNEYF